MYKILNLESLCHLGQFPLYEIRQTTITEATVHDGYAFWACKELSVTLENYEAKQLLLISSLQDQATPRCRRSTSCWYVLFLKDAHMGFVKAEYPDGDV